MNDAVREMFPEKRRIWMRRYSRSKLSRASRSGDPMIAIVDDRVAAAALTFDDFGRQQVDIDAFDAVARRHDQRPLDDVAQLANIAWPVVGLERSNRFLGDGWRWNASLGRETGEEMGDEVGNVLAPLAQATAVAPERHSAGNKGLRGTALR